MVQKLSQSKEYDWTVGRRIEKKKRRRRKERLA